MEKKGGFHQLFKLVHDTLKLDHMKWRMMLFFQKGFCFIKRFTESYLENSLQIDFNGAYKILFYVYVVEIHLLH